MHLYRQDYQFARDRIADLHRAAAAERLARIATTTERPVRASAPTALRALIATLRTPIHSQTVA